jgi:hypothetical protein
MEADIKVLGVVGFHEVQNEFGAGANALMVVEVQNNCTGNSSRRTNLPLMVDAAGHCAILRSRPPETLPYPSLSKDGRRFPECPID